MTTLFRRVLAALLCSATLAGWSKPAFAKCALQQVAQLPVRLTGGRLLIDAEVDGQPVKVILDTGAERSLMFADAARRLKLPTSEIGGGIRMYGVGGEFIPRQAYLDQLTLAGAELKGVSFWIAGQDGAEGAALLLGQDVLTHWDVEYDLAHTAVRLLHPVDCHGDEVVYWSQSYAKAAMQRSMDQDAKIEVGVRLNGALVSAFMDTGATTIVTPGAALRAGAQLSSTATKDEAFGLGPVRSVVRFGVFKSVDVGGEVIRNPRLAVADIFAAAVHDETGSILGVREDAPDMLIGLDFFMAHRLLVAPDQGVVYFTYSAGPVFAAPPPTGKDAAR